MKTILFLLFFGSTATQLTAQPNINAGLASRLQVNKTSFSQVRNLLGEPAYLSNHADQQVVQYKNGKNICLLNFNKDQLLTELMISLGDQEPPAALSYENAKLIAASPTQEMIQKLLGSPLDIRISATETSWWYKNGEKALGLIFREATAEPFLFNYTEENTSKATFTSADTEQLHIGTSRLSDARLKWGMPTNLQFTNTGEQWQYKNDRQQLWINAGRDGVITNYTLENLD